jgi:hypothetical protein
MSNKIICGSFDEHKSYYINQHYDKKHILQVKIIKVDENDESEKLEEKINLFLIEYYSKYDIIDIKYSEKSCMIIYKKV